MANIVYEDDNGNVANDKGQPIRSHADFPLHMWKGTKRADGSAIDYVCTVPGCGEQWTYVFARQRATLPPDAKER